MTNPNQQEQVSGLVLDLWEAKGRDAVTPHIEAICDKWQGTSPLVSNLIRAANDRYFSISIDPESGDVVITEPEGDLDGNLPMLQLLFSHFDAIQADASSHMVTYLHDIDADIAEAA